MEINCREDIEIGLMEIDAQHREIFDKINELIHLLESGASKCVFVKNLVEFQKHILTHFRTEESLMIENNCKCYEHHKMQHEYFKDWIIDKLLHYREDNQIIEEIATFSKIWMNNHIVNTDIKLKLLT